MLKRVFTAVCDARYFPGLKALLNSILAYHGTATPIFVYHAGFGSGELRWLEAHPLRIHVFRATDLPHYSGGMWEVKQQIFAHCLGQARCVFLLDADIVLTSSMDDVFAEAEAGKIVAGHDGGALSYDARYAVYGSDLPGKRHIHLNSGAICLDVERHWDLVGLWAFSSNLGEYSPHRGFPLHLPGHGDQGLFNALAFKLGKMHDVHVLPHGPWHEIGAESPMRILQVEPDGRLEVWNERLGVRQRFLHATGKKWWTEEGARRNGALGERLRCFHHFERMRLPGDFAVNPERVVPFGWDRFHDAPAGKRIFVAVCSCHLSTERRQAVGETWLNSLPAGMAALVFVGEGRGKVEEGVVQLPAADDYCSLPEKMHAIFRYVLQHYEFDYFFKCDDDTYLCAERLPYLIKEGVDFLGDETLTRENFAQGGAGYLVSRHGLEKLSEAGFPFRGPEDVYITRLAVRLGLSTEASAKLRRGSEEPPSPRNDLVTAHHVSPELMRRIWADFTNPPLVIREFTACHPHWNGRLELLGDGTFRGGASRPNGRWELSHDEAELTLKWYHWPEERLRRTDAGFAGEQLRVEMRETVLQA